MLRAYVDLFNRFCVGAKTFRMRVQQDEDSGACEGEKGALYYDEDDTLHSTSRYNQRRDSQGDVYHKWNVEGKAYLENSDDDRDSHCGQQT